MSNQNEENHQASDGQNLLIREREREMKRSFEKRRETSKKRERENLREKNTHRDEKAFIISVCLFISSSHEDTRVPRSNAYHSLAHTHAARARFTRGLDLEKTEKRGILNRDYFISLFLSRGKHKKLNKS